jgi:hypothetical protein
MSPDAWKRESFECIGMGKAGIGDHPCRGGCEEPEAGRNRRYHRVMREQVLPVRKKRE